MSNRFAMSPMQFDNAVRRLLHLHPYLSVTSGRRSIKHNAALPGSNPESKHVYGMAVDLSDRGADLSTGLIESVFTDAKALGLWILWHDSGTGKHFHVQGLPVGPIPEWWLERFWKKV